MIEKILLITLIQVVLDVMWGMWSIILHVMHLVSMIVVCYVFIVIILPMMKDYPGNMLWCMCTQSGCNKQRIHGAIPFVQPIVPQPNYSHWHNPTIRIGTLFFSKTTDYTKASV
jgi:hypothetical protein